MNLPSFRSRCILASAILLPTLALADDLPQKLPADRYNGMLEHSPFAVATAQVLPAQTPNFAKDLYVANAARVTGEDLVTLQSSSDKSTKEYLTTKGPNEHGISISNIEWSDRPGATKVTVTKDGQFATLTFNQALVSQIPPPPTQSIPAPNTAVPNPAAPTPIPAYAPPRPAATGAIPTPPPHVRGVISRNPRVPSTQPAAKPNPLNQSEQQ